MFSLFKKHKNDSKIEKIIDETSRLRNHSIETLNHEMQQIIQKIYKKTHEEIKNNKQLSFDI